MTSPQSRLYLMEGGIWSPPSPDSSVDDVTSDVDDVTDDVTTKVTRIRDVDSDIDTPPLKLPRVDETNISNET